MKVYLVGGAIRDKLLGLPVNERDWVVVGARPQDLLNLGYARVTGHFPVYLHPENGEEYALARIERKTDPGHKGFDVYAGPDVSLESDLARRDLTINAIAEDQDGRLIDPYGGRRDLESGVLRHVSPAFVEDPLRVLRTARFAARLASRGFEVEKATMTLMRHVSQGGELSTLSKQRVWRETHLALLETQPERYFEVLYTCGALAALAPELEQSIQATLADYPPAGLPVETLARSSAKTHDPQVRFAALAARAGSGIESGGSTDITHAVCRSLGATSEFTRLSQLVAESIPFPPTVRTLAPEGILDWLEHVDAFRRSRRFDRLMETCQVLCSTESDTLIATALRESQHAASQVDTRGIAATGLKGAAFGEQLRRRRVHAIRTKIIGRR